MKQIMSDASDLRHYAWPQVFPAAQSLTVVHSRRSGRRMKHDHDYLENVFVLSGSGRLLSTSGVTPLQPGCVLFIPSKTWHEYRDCRDLHLVFCSIKTELLTGDLQFLREQAPWSAVHDAIHAVQLGKSQLRRARRLLADTAKDSGDHRDSLDSIGLYLRLVALTRAGQGPAGKPALLHPLTRRTLDLLRAHLGAPITLLEMARQLNNVHPIYLGKIFKRDIGLSPMAYFNRLRCERAAGLLRATDEPVAEIAAQCGWDDANLFSRRFRSTFHTSPTNYRARPWSELA